MGNDTKAVCYIIPDDLGRIGGDSDIGVTVYGEAFGRYTLPLVTKSDYDEIEASFRLVVSTAQNRIAELTADLKVADRAALELAAEVDKYRKALADVAKESWNIESDHGDKIREGIRNALREGE